MSDKRHYSASQVEMGEKCMTQWSYRYEDRLIRPPGSAAQIGKGVHKSVEDNLTHKVTNGELLEPDAVAEAARDEVNRAFDEDGVHWTKEERSTGKDVVRGQCVDMSVKMALCHREEAAPIIEPGLNADGSPRIETKFNLAVEGYDFTLLGYMDIVDVAGKRLAVRDTKTGKKKNAGESLQLVVYAQAIEAIDGRLPDEVSLDNVTKLKTPKFERSSTQVTDEHLDVLWRRVENFHERVERGDRSYAPTSAWWCSQSWCGYWDICKGALRPVSV